MASSGFPKMESLETNVDSTASYGSEPKKGRIGKIAFTVSKEKEIVTIKTHLLRVFKRELGNFMDHLHSDYPDTKHLNFTHVFLPPDKNWIGVKVSGHGNFKEGLQKKHDPTNSVTECLNTYFRDRRISEQCGLAKDSGLDFTFYISYTQTPQKPSFPIAKSNDNTELYDVSFVFNVPTNVPLDNLFIRSSETELIDGRMHGKRMWCITFAFTKPEIDEVEGKRYYYELHIKSTGYVWRKAKVETMDNDKLRVESTAVHRDCYEDTVTLIVEQLVDLVSSKEYDKKQVCAQLDRFKHPNLARTLVHNVIENISFDAKDTFPEINFFLFIERILNNQYHLLDTVLTSDQAKALTAILVSMPIASFPEECQSNMLSISQKIFEIAFESNFSMTVYLNSVWNQCLEEKHKFNLVEYYLNHRSTIHLYRNQKDLNILCKTIFQDVLKGFDRMWNMFEEFFKILPGKNAFYVLVHIASEKMEGNSANLIEKLLPHVFDYINKFFSERSPEDDLDSVLDFILELETIPGCVNKEIRSRIEELLLKYLPIPRDKCSPQLFKPILRILNSEFVFVCSERKRELLQALAKSKSKLVRDNFCQICNNFEALQAPIQDILRSIPIQTTTQLIITNICELKERESRHEILFDIFNHLKWLLESFKPLTYDDNEILEQCFQVIQCSTWESLIDVTKSMDTTFHQFPKIVDSLTKNIAESIVDRCHQTQTEPCHIVMRMERDGKLIIDSRAELQVVCQLIEFCFENHSEDDNFVIFEQLTQHSGFWKNIARAEGRLSIELQEFDVYQRITQAIQHVANQYKSKEIFINKCKDIDTQNAKSLLKIYNVTENDISEISDIIKHKIKATKEDVTLVFDFLKCCTVRVPSLLDCNEVLLFLQNIIERLDTGAMSVKEYKSKEFWEEYKPLSNVPSNLFQVVKSEMFWICNAEDIRLFVSRNVTLDEESTLGGLAKIELIQKLKEFLSEKCLLKYRNEWKRLNDSAEITMKEVSNLLQTRSKMEQEIDIFESLYKQDTLLDDVKKALLNLSDSEKLPRIVTAIHAFVKTFSIDITDDDRISNSIHILDIVTSNNNSDISFSSVKEDLKRVTQLTECVNKETLSVIQALGNSERLLDFIRPIDIENVRTLYDAVDYISETNIEKETIKSLQDVVIFLNPMLKKITEKISLDAILHTMQDRINTVEDEKLDSKINDCNSNVYTLKYLYKNVANREEQTVDVISKIDRNGMFRFEVKDRCSTVTLSVNYNDTVSQNKFQGGEKKMNDLRSRTLLLKNSLNENEHLPNFNSFLSKVETAFEIKYIMKAIVDSGCTLDSASVQGSALCVEKKRLSDQLLEWKTKLDDARKQHFLLTFVHGRKINILIKYLQNKHPHSNEDENEVKTILQFIYPDFNVRYLQTAYDKAENDCEIIRLGCALHRVYNDEFPTQVNVTGSFMDSVEMKHTKCNIRPPYIERYILFVRLRENNPDLLRTITTLYMQECNRMPLPHELITCSTSTSLEELQSLVMRCKRSSEFKHVQRSLFCIANIEILSADLQSKLIQDLGPIVKHKQGRLAIICRLNSLHPFVQNFSEHEFQLELLTTADMSKKMREHCKDIKTFTSPIAGQGKTSTIVEKAMRSHEKCIRTLHISGKFNEKHTLIQLNTLRIQPWQILHIDIGVTSNVDELDQFIFRLVALKYASVESTAFFLSSTIVYIEIASSNDKLFKSGLRATMMFDEIPSDTDPISRLVISEEPYSPIQVVSHYLKRLEDGTINHEDYTFQQTPVEGELCKTLLRKYIKQCRNMSFSQIQVFVYILADQLKRFTLSNFFKVDVLKGMAKEGKENIVRKSILENIIQMANDIADRPVQFSENTNTKVNFAIEKLKRIERWDQRNQFACVFNESNEQTITVLYRSENKLPVNIQKVIHHQLRQGLPKYTDMTQEQLYDVLHRILGKTSNIPGDYVLTPDNLLKMTLIMLRIWASVPVVIMGETGCGKTSLIRVLANACRVPCRVVRLHAGVSENEILEFLTEENNECKKNPFEQRWLFIDEINTTECIGVISDLISHGMIYGELIAPNLKTVGACNPYKQRITLPSEAGGINTKLQNDPLSYLEYRVVPLPESVLQYVWDFGSLTEKDEHEYIRAMVYTLCKNSEFKNNIIDVIMRSQVFIKSSKEYTSTVSLRDVNRCLKLIHWFYDLQKRLGEKKDEIQAVILAMVLTYQMRFRDKCLRQKYEEVIANAFSITGGKVAEIVLMAQNAIVSEMECPEGTAINSILRDNIFVLLVSIINKIPVMLVGKPGSSKSLSIQIIQNNLRGLDSKKDLFQNYPRLICVPYQGSETATSEGIDEVFEKAIKRQHSENDVLAVVILDEIGLSEVSPFNPLKVLHSRLESYEGGTPEVAVVGLSNWALDAAKMNRAIHIYIPDMDEDELASTAHELRKSIPNCIELSQEEENDFRKVAKAYLRYMTEVVNNGNHMYGLRDFYALVKYVVRNQAIKGLDKRDQNDVMLEGFQRNFNGMPEGNIFVKMFFQKDTLPLIPIKDLIISNINDLLARHLMIISRGNVSINIVENIVDNILKRRKEVIIGSCFKEDQNDEYYYRILSRIIFSMEQGHVLILKNLDPLYGSLYDMLNQRYTTVANRKTCRVALGQYTNPFCHVADEFRCIVFVDESALNRSDPPFLNRFEKQLLCESNVLDKQQNIVYEHVANWIKALRRDDVVTGVFPCFDEESIISLVSYATSVNQDAEQSFELCRNLLLWLLLPDAFVRAREVLKAKEQEHTYLSLPIHEGLESYITFQKSGQGTSLSIELTMVFTFSNVHSSLHIPNTVNLCSFQSEKQFTEMVQLFLSATDSDLVIQSDVVEDIKLIPLARFILDRLKSEMMLKISTPKRVYFVMHCRKQKLSNVITESSDCVSGRKVFIYAINFLSGWKYVTIDTIEKPSCTIPNVLRKSLCESIRTLKPVEVIVREELFWSFTRIHYSVNGRSIDDIVNLVTSIWNKGSMIYNIIADLVRSNIGKRYTQIGSEWVQSFAKDNLLLNSFTQALEQHLTTMVKKEIAKVVYCFELFGFFSDIENISNNVDLVSKQRLLSISAIGDETGPGCYMCTAPNLNYQNVFSHIIYERLELSKSDFIKHLNSVQLKPGCISQILQSAKVTLVSKCQTTNEFTKVLEAYEHDYFLLFVHQLNPDYGKDSIELLKVVFNAFWNISLMENYKEKVLFLHYTGWIFYHEWSTILEMFEKFRHFYNDSAISLLAHLKESKKINEPPESVLEDIICNRPGPYREVFADVVDYVGERLFPTNSQLQGDLYRWQELVQHFVYEAESISEQPRTLPSLQLCMEAFVHRQAFESDFIPLFDILCQQLRSTRIDSPPVLEAVRSIIGSMNSSTDASSIQRLVRQCMISCQIFDENSTVHNWFIDGIKNEYFPDDELFIFKTTIVLLLENNQASILDKGMEPYMLGSFCQILNDCLHNLFNQHRFNFIILVIDVFESIFLKTLEDQISIETLLDAGSSLRKRNIGLNYFKSMSYIRAIVRFLSLNPEPKIRDTVFPKVIEVILSLREKDLFQDLIRYTANVMNTSSDRHLFQDSLEQTNGIIHQSLHFNPTTLYLICHCDGHEKNQEILQRLTVNVHSDLDFETDEPLENIIYFWFIMEHVYCKNVDSFVSNGEKAKCEELRTILKFEELYDDQRLFMEKIIGKTEFRVPQFNANSSMTYEDSIIASLFISASALIVFKKCGINENSILKICLQNPLKLNFQFPIASPINVSLGQSNLNFPCNDVYTCKCQKTFVFVVDRKEARCNVCGKSEYLQKDTVSCHTDWEPKDNEFEEMSLLSKEILSFVLKGFILLHVANEVVEEEKLKKLFQSECTIEQIWNDICCHWSNIRSIFNLDSFETGLVMYNFVVESDKNKKPWVLLERNFEGLDDDVSSVFKERHRHLDNFVQMLETKRHDSRVEKPKNTFFRCVFRTMSFPKLEECFWIAKRKLPFLKFVMDHQLLLQLPCHLIRFINWHMSVFRNTGRFKIKRDITIEKYLEILSKADNVASSDLTFDALLKTWAILKTRGIPFPLEELSYETKIHNSIILNGNGQIDRVFNFLIEIQNRTLAACGKLASQCKCLDFLLRDKCAFFKSTSVSEIKEHELLYLNATWDNIIKDESHSGLSEKDGRKVYYDFYSIEKALVSHLIIGKKYIIHREMPHVVFADEFYKNICTLLKEVSENIHQEPLPSEIESHLRTKFEQDVCLASEILRHLVLICTLLKTTKDDAVSPFEDFIRRQSVLKNFPESCFPDTAIPLRLCHSVALHELLEEIYIDSKYSNLVVDKTPFGDFLNKSLKQFQFEDLDFLQKALKRFVYRKGDTDALDDQRVVSLLSEPCFWSSQTMINGVIRFKDRELKLAELIHIDLRVKDITSMIGSIQKCLKEKQEKRKIPVVVSKLETRDSKVFVPRRKASKIGKI